MDLYPYVYIYMEIHPCIGTVYDSSILTVYPSFLPEFTSLDFNRNIYLWYKYRTEIYEYMAVILCLIYIFLLLCFTFEEDTFVAC